MGNISIRLMLFCLVFVMWAAHANFQDPTQDESILQQNFCRGKEKVTKFRFYIQDILEGPNATVWEVAHAAITPRSDSYFGLVRVMDNLITVKPDRYSKKLGRLQAIIAFSDLNEMAVTITINFYFTTGKLNGSTLCLLGRIPLAGDFGKEVAIVGGTGYFRMARGYSILRTYSFNHTINYGILEYTSTVYHYVDEPHLEMMVDGDEE